MLTRVEKLVVVLRDGRKVLGVLRTWDQFGRFFLYFFLFPLSPLLTALLTDGSQLNITKRRRENVFAACIL